MIPVTDEQLASAGRVYAKAWGAPKDKIAEIGRKYCAIYRQHEAELMADLCLVIEAAK